MIGGLDNNWREKGLPRIGHRLAFCSLLILMFLRLVIRILSISRNIPESYMSLINIFL